MGFSQEQIDEALLRAITDGVEDGIVSADASGLITYFNHASERLFRLRACDAIGKPLTILMPERFKDPHRRGFARFLATGEKHLIGRTIELVGCRSDGSEFPLELSLSLSEAGGKLLFAAVIRDISERKRAEDAHRLAEAKLSGIVRVAADAIISVDEDQRITLFNDGAERIFGYSKREALGAPLDLLIPEQFRAVHRDHVRRFASGKNAARRMGERGTAISGKRKNGETFPAEAVISRLEVGGRTVLTVVLRDVTEQKLVEADQRVLAEIGEVLASSPDYEERLTRIADCSVKFLSDCSIVDVVDGEGRLARLRVAVADPAHEALAKRLHDLPIERTHPLLSWQGMTTRRSILVPELSPDSLLELTQEGEHRRILRELGPKSLIAVPLVARERLVGSISFLSCRAGRRYGPRDLWLAEEIARRAAISIDNARLYRAANLAIQARDQVLGVVAHDLRSPLNAVLMIASGLLRRAPAEPDSGVRSGLERIVRSVERTNRLIQDLLDITAIESGRFSLDTARHSPARLVAEAIEVVRLTTTVEIEVLVPDDLPAVVADRDRVLQVFSNLLANAAKFTPGGRITVGAVQRGDEVCFRVADTGCGISREDLPHIFDRFWQAESAHRRGHGFGLSICKGIVEAHGGRIWAESELGIGSTFFFTLPAVSSASDRQASVPA